MPPTSIAIRGGVGCKQSSGRGETREFDYSKRIAAHAEAARKKCGHRRLDGRPLRSSSARRRRRVAQDTSEKRREDSRAASWTDAERDYSQGRPLTPATRTQLRVPLPWGTKSGRPGLDS